VYYGTSGIECVVIRYKRRNQDVLQLSKRIETKILR
jgi:hypothetical protein